MLLSPPLTDVETVEPAQAVVQAALSFLRPASAALFALDAATWRLAWADRVADADLRAVLGLDDERLHILRMGATVRVLQPPALLVPCLANGDLLGVLYLSPPPSPQRLPRCHLPLVGNLLGLGFALERIAASEALDPAQLDTPLIVDPQAAADRDQLLLLLEAHEWNVSRVARFLGVTRMTIYNRLRRARIQRRKVRKGRQRSRGDAPTNRVPSDRPGRRSSRARG
jgi:hypothetical protein